MDALWPIFWARCMVLPFIIRQQRTDFKMPRPTLSQNNIYSLPRTSFQNFLLPVPVLTRSQPMWLAVLNNCSPNVKCHVLFTWKWKSFLSPNTKKSLTKFGVETRKPMSYHLFGNSQHNGLTWKVNLPGWKPCNLLISTENVLLYAFNYIGSFFSGHQIQLLNNDSPLWNFVAGTAVKSGVSVASHVREVQQDNDMIEEVELTDEIPVYARARISQVGNQMCQCVIHVQAVFFSVILRS